jgi:hypothetical protein
MLSSLCRLYAVLLTTIYMYAIQDVQPQQQTGLSTVLPHERCFQVSWLECADANLMFFQYSGVQTLYTGHC